MRNTQPQYTVDFEMWLKGASEECLTVLAAPSQPAPPDRRCMDCGHAVSRYAHRAVCWVCERARTDRRLKIEDKQAEERERRGERLIRDGALAGVHTQGRTPR